MLVDRGWQKPLAYLATEALSGVFHGLVAGSLTYALSLDLEWTACVASVVFFFWAGIGLGRASACENQQQKGRAPGTREEAIAAFMRNPLSCMRGFRGSDPWKEDGCEDLYVVAQEWPLGYVHRIHIDAARSQATIGHFAVEKGLEGEGIGRHLALTLQAELARRYRVQRIVFSEDSPNYVSAGYAAFFAKLGAVAVCNPDSIHHDWAW
jgi:hypothetical protein